ncbi:autotransporter outer membrane beta-barrel domain-containing protein [Salmonella enterica subsp. enterica]|nr:autotransporter outer membrane beta-barrel domain-containing protein [Salmonella enterica subsp. enterica]
MENKLRPSHIATCISLILGSGLALYAPLSFSACGEYNQAGTCGLAEFTMTSPKMPLPTAWYFVQPTQEAAINTLAKAQNIYFGGGSAIRKPNDSQSLLVDGANLSGYYINASKEGSATIALVNHATVDWLEAGGSKTNIHVLVDNSTLNGANAETDYDRTEKKPNYSKNYAKGMAIYLSYTDGGDHLVDIVNDSTLNGSVISGGAAKLSLGGVGDAVVSIVGGKALTLTGASGTQLIDMAGQPDASVTVNVENGALNLGAIVVGDTVNVLQGTVNVGETGALNIIAGDHTIEDKSGSGVTSAGQITILHNAALHTNVTLAGSGELAVNGALQANALNAQSDTLITVGNAENAGLLRADNVDLQGARMFIDPQWQANPALKDASRVALNGETVNGRLTAGQNALLVLGDTDTHTAETDFADSGLRWSPDGITAALAIERAQYLNPTQGGLRVDGALHSGAGDYDATFNQAEFGERSLLMVNRDSTSGGNAALTASSGTLKVADTATLYVKDAVANQTYTIAKGFSDVELAGSGWQNERLILNKLLNATTMEHDGSVIVSTLAKKAEDVLPGVVPVHALDQMINRGTNSLTSPWAGIRFLSQAVDDPQASVHEVVKTVNSAAQLAIAGGVQASTLATGLAASQAIQDRMSLANRALQREDAVWVQALYGNQRARDFSAGNMDYGYDSDYYGLMLGADATLESDSGKWRTGAALHAGHGNTDSRGDFNSTHNNVDFWGISLYQNWSNGRVNVTGDIGYNASSNDIEQKIPGWMNAGNTLKGSPDSQLITAGITGEYLISTQAIDILPHAGVRYNQLKTKGFTTKNTHREAVFTTQEETLDIWQFPVGVKLNKTFDLDAGWGLSTQADFAVITNTGDTQSATKISAVGINASDGISANFIDKTTFAGQIGVKLQKGDMRWGLGYSVNTSSHNTDQMINATWQLSF